MASRSCPTSACRSWKSLRTTRSSFGCVGARRLSVLAGVVRFRSCVLLWRFETRTNKVRFSPTSRWQAPGRCSQRGGTLDVPHRRISAIFPVGP
eukprot:scaffold923_cov256-Pinguiococcus_pyrenoidosus.AAC.15